MTPGPNAGSALLRDLGHVANRRGTTPDGEWKTGRRATATVTAAVVFALSAGLALDGALAGWLFSSHGYVPNATRTARSLMGIRMTASVYASLAFAATAGCLLFYAITKEANRKIADDLDERRKKYASAMA